MPAELRQRSGGSCWVGETLRSVLSSKAKPDLALIDALYGVLVVMCLSEPSFWS